MLDLTLLDHALAVLEAGSFAGAAKSQGLSQPTLSRHISSLESLLGVRLFDRGRHGAIPTPLGQQILTRASGLVRSAELLSREIGLLRGVEIGEVKVGAGVYPSFISLGRALGRLASNNPGLRLSVTVGHWRTMVAEVLQGRLDLAVTELSEFEGHPDLKTEPLPEHQGAFICRSGHPLLDIPEPTLADLFGHPFAGTRLAPRVVRLLSDRLTAGHVDEVTGEYIPSIEVNTIRIATEAVAESNAFAIVPLFAIGDLLRSGRVQALSLQPPWLKTRYGFITLRDRTLSPAAALFMHEVRALELDIAAEELRPPVKTPRKRGRKS